MAEQQHRIWLYSPLIDLLVGCGGWTVLLLPLAVLVGLWYPLELATFFYGAALLCNYPHYMATIERAYHSKEDRDHYYIYTTQLAGLTILSLILVHVYPVLMPYVFTVYLFWSPWHYSGQNFGISVLFLKRGKVNLFESARSALFLVFITSYLLRLLALSGLPSDNPWVFSLYLRKDVLLFGEVVLSAACLAFVALFWWLVRKEITQEAILPLCVLLAAQLSWFVAPFFLELVGYSLFDAVFYSAGVLAFLHCAQYLWITSFFARSRAVSEGQPWSLRSYYTTLVFGGVCLFIVGPWLTSVVFSYDLFLSLFIFMAVINIHHFILDGAVWKLRRSPVAQHLVHESQLKAGKQAKGGHARRGKRRVLLAGVGLFAIAIALIDQYQAAAIRFAKTKDDLTLPAALAPTDSRVVAKMAEQHLLQNEAQEALKLLTSATDSNPYSFEIQGLLGELLLRLNSAEKALDHFRSLHSLFPAVPSLLLSTANAALQAEKPAEAFEYLKKAALRDPKNVKVLANLIQAARSAGLHEDYRKFLEYTVFLESDVREEKAIQVRLALELAKYFETTQLLREALVSYERTGVIADQVGLLEARLEALVQQSKIYIAQGVLLPATNLLDEAESLAKKLGDSGKIAIIHMFRGDMALMQANRDGASAYYKRAVEAARASRLEPLVALIEQRAQEARLP